MATTPNFSSSYVGQDAGRFYSIALKQLKTLEYVDIIANIKYQKVLKSLDVTNAIKDKTCTFNAGGSVDLSETLLTPKRLSIELEMCSDDLVDTWESSQLGFGVNAESILNTDFNSYLIGRILDKQAAALETMIWQGTDIANSFPGFIAKIGTGATEVTITATTNASNVIEHIGQVYDDVADEVMAQEDFVIAVSSDISRAYGRALSALGYLNAYNVGSKEGLDFEGKKLVVMPGLPAQSIIAMRTSNFVFGTDLMSDYNSLKVKDMSDSNLDSTVRYKHNFSAGVAIMNQSELVYRLA